MTSEEQHLTCAATNGTFRLSFRGEVTDPLPFDISAKVRSFVRACLLLVVRACTNVGTPLSATPSSSTT